MTGYRMLYASKQSIDSNQNRVRVTIKGFHYFAKKSRKTHVS